MASRWSWCYDIILCALKKNLSNLTPPSPPLLTYMDMQSHINFTITLQLFSNTPFLHLLSHYFSLSHILFENFFYKVKLNDHKIKTILLHYINLFKWLSDLYLEEWF
jgi:hypothetical protein